MRDGWRIIPANQIKHEVERGENQHAPNGSDPKYNLRKSHD
jgi:hypothetical protein